MVRPFFLVWCCILFSAVSSWALCPEYEAGIHAKLLTIYYRHPEYHLGGTLKDGKIDCSELVRQAAELVGVPRSKRKVRACDIFEGSQPWGNVVIPKWNTGDNRRVDLIFEHIENGLVRPWGVNHILAVVEWEGVFHVMHASSSRKTVVIEPLAPWVTRSMVDGGYRRMTLGDQGALP